MASRSRKSTPAKRSRRKKVAVPPKANPTKSLARIGQVQWDHYYMDVARTVRTRANCLGSRVGAVLVLNNRIVSTGFNGSPAGFPNCEDGGCVRCRERYLFEHGLHDEITEPDLASGPKQLDLCICVHAEANALLSAARFGNQTAGSTLYTTHEPCFACLKEAVQAGVERVVYLHEWIPDDRESLRQQYELLAEHLRNNDARNFEQIALQRTLIKGTGGEIRNPDLDEEILQAQEEFKKKIAKKKGADTRARNAKNAQNRKAGKRASSSRSPSRSKSAASAKKSGETTKPPARRSKTGTRP